MEKSLLRLTKSDKHSIMLVMKIRNLVLIACVMSSLSFTSCESLKAIFTSSNNSKSESQDEKKLVEEVIQKIDVNDEEYNRSTVSVSITKEEFSADKKQILRIIAELESVMQKYDYSSWLNFIEPESVTYWSNPTNLRNATKRLPNKYKAENVRLLSLNDYFTYVFVPSRKDRSVDEIRYVSLNSVKAVQMRDETDVVYYNFVKVNGQWMIRLPTLTVSAN